VLEGRLLPEEEGQTKLIGQLIVARIACKVTHSYSGLSSLFSVKSLLLRLAPSASLVCPSSTLLESSYEISNDKTYFLFLYTPYFDFYSFDSSQCLALLKTKAEV